MSVVKFPTRPGAQLDYAAVIAAVEADVSEARSLAFLVPGPEQRPSFLLGHLAGVVADFLNAHPEHRGELLPALVADTTERGW